MLQQDNQDTQEAQEEQVQDQDDSIVINPYIIVNKTGKKIDNEKLIQKFGCQKITPELIAKVEALTGKPAHRLLRRNIFFAHRDVDKLLAAYEDKKPFYIYTGRGPSADCMHVGHLVPFLFTKYLQDAFQVPVVIMLSDDEKFFHQKTDNTLDDYRRFGLENAKDILACGFDLDKTFLFLNSDYMGTMYKNVCKFQRSITFSQMRALFGFENSDNCGKAYYPAVQAVPCAASTFPHIFPNDDFFCLVPQGIDQDPYFRMTRDVCYKLNIPKTTCIHSEFMPSLQGYGEKMSTSDPNSAIFLTDTQAQIAEKIKLSLSGGGMTKKEHQEKGADLSVDVPYHYLRFFLEDDARLEEIKEKYSKGIMFTSEVKKELTAVIQKLLAEHQERRAKITDEEVKKFMEIRPINAQVRK